MRQTQPVGCVKPRTLESLAQTKSRIKPRLKSIFTPDAKAALCGAAIGAGAAVFIGMISVAVADKLDEIAISVPKASLAAVPEQLRKCTTASHGQR